MEGRDPREPGDSGERLEPPGELRTGPIGGPESGLAEPGILNNDNLRANEFLTTLAEALGDNFKFPDHVNTKLHQIANLMAAVSVMEKDIGKSSIDYLKRVFQSELGIELQGSEEDKQGYFYRLAKTLPHSDGHKPGGLFFAILPEGHRAPLHIHRGGGTPVGEITTTLQGTLRYIMGGDGIYAHTKDDAPRVSAADSLDIYLKQEDFWAGFYYQPEMCSVQEKSDLARDEVGEICESLVMAVERLLRENEELATQRAARGALSIE